MGEKTKQILLITHQLSYTGAPIAMMQLAQFFLKKGYTIDVISLKDGPQKYDYDKMGISVWIIKNLEQNEKELEDVIGDYDKIVVNTLACAPVCEFLSGKDEQVYWWIHENELLFKQIKGYLEQLRLKENIHVLAAGYYVQMLIEKYIKCTAQIMNICIPDKKSIVISHEKIRFAQIGLTDGMKGQEVFLRAIMLLPDKIRNLCEFYIVGSLKNANKDIVNAIRLAQKIYPCIYLLDEMEQEQLYEFYDEIDCVVVPSRLESMSAVMIEGFMKEKVCICTTTTGIAKYIKDGENGFIFPEGDSETLRDIIKYIVKKYNNMMEVKNRGRKIYEKYFSPECFEQTVKKLILGE